MIRKTLLSIFALFASMMMTGQVKSEKKEQLKALKVAFITEELALTTDEAQKFWPVYNAYDNKQFEIRQQKLRALQRRMNDGQINGMSDKEADSFLSQIENTEEELYLLRKKLNSNLRKIISPLKIIKLKKAEEDFNRKLLRQYRSSKKK